MIYLERALNGGTQVVHKFDNGYGASVVCHDYSYGGDQGLKELAVLKFEDEEEWHLCYTTLITDDVIGYLEDDCVEELLVAIKNLTPWKEIH